MLSLIAHRSQSSAQRYRRCVVPSNALRAAVVCALALAAVGASAARAGEAQRWVAAWSDSPSNATPSAVNDAGSEQSFRAIVRPTVGSRELVRVHFTNVFGAAPVRLAAARIAVRRSGAAVDPSSDRALSFDGASGVTLAPGASVLSDPVRLHFSYGQDLAVSEYISGNWRALTQHNQGPNVVTSYQTAPGAGDATADASGAAFAQPTFETYIVDRVDVYGAYRGTVAMLGSSTTDGYHSGLDVHGTYPERVAAALHAAGHDDIAVANAGIAGDAVLAGTSTARFHVAPAVDRFARDVAGLPGIYAVVQATGANDLRIDCVSATRLIAGTRRLIASARAAHLRYIAATIAPSTFCGAQRPLDITARFAGGSGGDRERLVYNAWVRSAAGPGGFADFARALADPAHPAYLRSELSWGDDVHPNDAGYAAQAAAVPLDMLLR